MVARGWKEDRADPAHELGVEGEGKGGLSMTSRFGAGAIGNKDVLQMTSCWVGIQEERGGSPDKFYQLEYSLVRGVLREKICLECSCFRGVRKKCLRRQGSYRWESGICLSIGETQFKVTSEGLMVQTG